MVRSSKSADGEAPSHGNNSGNSNNNSGGGNDNSGSSNSGNPEVKEEIGLYYIIEEISGDSSPEEGEIVNNVEVKKDSPDLVNDSRTMPANESNDHVNDRENSEKTGDDLDYDELHLRQAILKDMVKKIDSSSTRSDKSRSRRSSGSVSTSRDSAKASSSRASASRRTQSSEYPREIEEEYLRTQLLLDVAKKRNDGRQEPAGWRKRTLSSGIVVKERCSPVRSSNKTKNRGASGSSRYSHSKMYSPAPKYSPIRAPTPEHASRVSRTFRSRPKQAERLVQINHAKPFLSVVNSGYHESHVPRATSVASANNCLNEQDSVNAIQLTVPNSSIKMPYGTSVYSVAGTNNSFNERHLARSIQATVPNLPERMSYGNSNTNTNDINGDLVGAIQITVPNPPRKINPVIINMNEQSSDEDEDERTNKRQKVQTPTPSPPKRTIELRTSTTYKRLGDPFILRNSPPIHPKSPRRAVNYQPRTLSFSNVSNSNQVNFESPHRKWTNSNSSLVPNDYSSEDPRLPPWFQESLKHFLNKVKQSMKDAERVKQDELAIAHNINQGELASGAGELTRITPTEVTVPRKTAGNISINLDSDTGHTQRTNAREAFQNYQKSSTTQSDGQKETTKQQSSKAPSSSNTNLQFLSDEQQLEYLQLQSKICELEHKAKVQQDKQNTVSQNSNSDRVNQSSHRKPLESKNSSTTASRSNKETRSNNSNNNLTSNVSPPLGTQTSDNASSIGNSLTNLARGTGIVEKKNATLLDLPSEKDERRSNQSTLVPERQVKLKTVATKSVIPASDTSRADSPRAQESVDQEREALYRREHELREQIKKQLETSREQMNLLSLKALERAVLTSRGEIVKSLGELKSGIEKIAGQQTKANQTKIHIESLEHQLKVARDTFREQKYLIDTMKISSDIKKIATAEQQAKCTKQEEECKEMGIKVKGSNYTLPDKYEEELESSRTDVEKQTKLLARATRAGNRPHTTYPAPSPRALYRQIAVKRAIRRTNQWRRFSINKNISTNTNSNYRQPGNATGTNESNEPLTQYYSEDESDDGERNNIPAYNYRDKLQMIETKPEDNRRYGYVRKRLKSSKYEKYISPLWIIAGEDDGAIQSQMLGMAVQKINPALTMCTYEMRSVCQSEACTFQHLYKLNPVKQPT